MITVTIEGKEQLIARFASMPSKLREALLRKMNVITNELRTYIVKGKLSGQVLNKRTGALQRSTTPEVSSTATSVTGRVFSSGDVKYAAIHEYGGEVKTRLGTGKGKPKPGGKASFMMPERSFMRSALKDKEEYIRGQIQAAANEAIK